MTLNQPDAANNTRYGIGKALTMNKDEVEEDPSEEEGIEVFEVKGTGALEEDGIDALLEKVNSTALSYQGQGGNFEQFLQKLMRLKVDMPTKEMLE